jgi:catechol 2,3-dioxygenase-like lactoylglutathione lyase family enzyme
MDRAVAFYTGVLNFTRVADAEAAGEAVERQSGVFGARVRQVRLQLGEECLDLTEFLAPRGRAVPADTRSNDRWFQHVAIVVRDMDEAYRHLRRHKVEHASTGPQRLPDENPTAGGIRAFYFRDPDGHHLEVLQFPPGKGDARWHRPGERLFLGIDHTAVVVADTAASLGYYRDRLGLKVVGAGENSGTEQEHLNNVFGARLRITTLRAGRGPGIELLEYLAPRDGRPRPADTHANDLWHWQVRVEAEGVAALARGLAARLEPWGEAGWGFPAQDPDGHALLVTGQ